MVVLVQAVNRSGSQRGMVARCGCGAEPPLLAHERVVRGVHLVQLPGGRHFTQQHLHARRLRRHLPLGLPVPQRRLLFTCGIAWSAPSWADKSWVTAPARDSSLCRTVQWEQHEQGCIVVTRTRPPRL